MLSKKVMGLVAFLFSFQVLALSSEAAVPPVAYKPEVNVSVYSNGSLAVSVNQFYQLRNLDSGIGYVAPAGAKVTASADATQVKAVLGSVTYASVKGFKLEELPGNLSFVHFTSPTVMRRGASEGYEPVRTHQKSEMVTYNSTIKNGAGETWYNVTQNGKTGWVPAKTSKLEKTSTALSLSTIGTKKYRGSIHIKKNGTNVQAINYLGMEDYLKGVVPSEMPSSWQKEALKAQAVAARSYAANNMIMSNTARSQVYNGYNVEVASTNTAIQETEGVMIKYEGKPIEAFFHSTSGGRTANVGDVWNSSQASFPYLKSVDSPYEKSAHANWQHTFEPDVLLKSFGYNPSTTTLYDVKTTTRGENNEIGAVTIETSEGSKTITGNENKIRKIFPLPSPYNYLKSNWFTLQAPKGLSNVYVQTATGQEKQTTLANQKVQTANGQVAATNTMNIQLTSSTVRAPYGVTSVIVDGKGWGHRIGMSQYGAKGFAEQGWTYDKILKHFYPGTTVSK